LLLHGLFAARRLLLFDLDNAVTSLARTVLPRANTHAERPLALACGVIAQKEIPSSVKSPSFLQICRPQPLGLGWYTLAMWRHQLAEKWRGCFYTTIEPNPDTKSDSYNPTREYFNVMDGAVATTDDTEDDGNAATATPFQQEEPTPGPLGREDDGTLLLMTTRPRSLCNWLS
jgi:hypothetical protein